MDKLQRLARGELVVYIATRLFDFHEKLKAQKLEEAVLEGLKIAAKDRHIPIENSKLTFVPFRDTSQQMAMSVIDTGPIYLQDIERLDRLAALVCFLDGPSKDEGVCFELGYCFAKERPSVVVQTDFIRHSFKGHHQHFTLDPVIEAIIRQKVWNYEISTSHSAWELNLQASIQDTLDMVTRIMAEIARSNFLCTSAANEMVNNDVYIDFGGGLFEWERHMTDNLNHILKNRGFSVEVGCRYSAMPSPDTLWDPKRAGQEDLAKCARSKMVVTCSDSWEMSPGTAAIQGFARAKNKKILLYDSKATDIVGDNGYRSSRNLMVVHSSSKIVNRFEDIADALIDLQNEFC